MPRQTPTKKASSPGRSAPASGSSSRSSRRPSAQPSARAQKKTPPLEQPLVRVLLAAAAVALIVFACTGLTALLPKPDPEDFVQAGSAPTPVPEETAEPTPSPVPTVTPTPAEFAPFGVQYGYGDASLIPATPTPGAGVTPSPAQAVTPSPQPTATPARVLKKGMTGESVRQMQEALISLGYLDDAADGSFGQKTYDALVMFQAVNSLGADGIAGQQTLGTLYGGSALPASAAPEMDYLLLVNRENKLDKSYMPTDLVSIESVIPSDVVKVKYSGTKANRTAVEALGRMLEDAAAQGIGDWQISSAYRGYADQQKLVDNSVANYQKNNPSWSKERCLSATYQTVAPAGTSEHQTGLAFDMTVPGVSFTGTKQQKWLHEHCYEYGFVVRFTEDKQAITGFLAESWHIRYVGTQVAQVMTYNNWCLEEYIEKMGVH